ncbi:MAG TPA: XdhC family protein, partial [Kofleriaceae bacterium]|nr:XdhC family protein [Kofleriaceae bacterium]
MKQWLETRDVLDFLERARAAGRRAALATVVRVRGSAYRHEGAKLAVAEDGSSAGNVSGGCLEQDVREVALQVLQSGACQLRNYCSSADEIEAWDLGVGCEGQVDVYVEPAEPRPRERALLNGRTAFAVCSLLAGQGKEGSGKRLIVTRQATEGDLGSAELNRAAGTRARELLETGESGIRDVAGRSVFFDVLSPPPQLVVVGAGDDARPLARFAADVGFRVVVADRRPGLLTHERFPAAALLVESRGEELATVLPLDAECYAVVMNHSFADD